MPVKTYLIQRNDRQIREAIERELERDGQVYVVHNRVHSIYHVADQLHRLVPGARIGIGHGQLPEHQLERVMLDFYTGKTNVLVCTTIIENGLDVSSANTIIIDDAPYYGLAQLYQLRGRVGRSTQRAYCYLCLPPGVPLTIEAHQRLQAIQEATELGAGFRIAMRDLEIRGAGNVLGAEQSGHISAVGFDLYSRLLEQAVRAMKFRFDNTQLQPSEDVQAVPTPHKRIKVDEKVLVTPLVTVDLPLNAFLPVDYIPDDQVRLSTYQHLAEAQTIVAVKGLRAMLRDRFGKPPEPVEHLLTWLHIKTPGTASRSAIGGCNRTRIHHQTSRWPRRTAQSTEPALYPRSPHQNRPAIRPHRAVPSRGCLARTHHRGPRMSPTHSRIIQRHTEGTSHDPHHLRH